MENRLYRTTFYDNEKDKDGGGSGDFTTAKVVVEGIDDSNPGVAICGMAEIINPEDEDYPETLITYVSQIFDREWNVPLYKGAALLVGTFANTFDVVAEGNAEVFADIGEILITGDCKLTFTEKGGGSV